MPPDALELAFWAILSQDGRMIESSFTLEELSSKWIIGKIEFGATKEMPLEVLIYLHMLAEDIH